MEKQVTRKNGHLDRVVLNGEVVSRVDKWISEIESEFRGTRLTRSGIVNHLLGCRPENLSIDEKSKLADTGFDEIRFAAWALKEIRKAKGRGELLTLAQLLAKRGVSDSDGEKK